MKMPAKFGIAALVLVMMAFACATAFAADTNPTKTLFTTFIDKQKVTGEQPELTEAQKAEMITKAKEVLSQRLAEGNITQEQYDQAIAKVEEGDCIGFKIKGIGHPELTDEQKAEMITKAKAALNQRLAEGNITQEQYDQIITELENGNIKGFGMGWAKHHELTDEQKAEMLTKAKDGKGLHKTFFSFE